MITKFKDEIFLVNENNFDALALRIFKFQAEYCSVYKRYLELLQIHPADISSIEDIPFLPIRFFKTQQIITTENKLPSGFDAIFESSGTTGTEHKSKHYISDITLYERSFLLSFNKFIAHEKKVCIIGLMPSYLERKNASLVYMVQKLIQSSPYTQSGFYLYNFNELAVTLKALEAKKIPVVLFGVTFALLDFAEQFPMPLKNVIIIETGGMKGRSKEITRQEVHEKLATAFAHATIYSEYGMTELLSQSYLIKNNIFTSPNWKRVFVRDPYNPQHVSRVGKGALNIIDLANLNSCCFIATDDVGTVFSNKTFTVDGRIEQSELRGCSLLY